METCAYRVTVVGWSSPQDSALGFIDPSSYTTPDIICHREATPGGTYATVAAGGTVELQWTPWPTSHHGPVIDYLANCNGECTNVDKTTLLFNKIDGVGLIDDSAEPGTWAADQLRVANNSWTVTIPSSIAPGIYVLRHEIIALHAADNANGAQHYPQCINLNITGSGTNNLPSGTFGTSLYKSTDPGIRVNIYTTLSSYQVPGPAFLGGAVPGPQPSSLLLSSISVTPSSLGVSVTTSSSGSGGLPTTFFISSTTPAYLNSSVAQSASPSSSFDSFATTTVAASPALPAPSTLVTQVSNPSSGWNAVSTTSSTAAHVFSS